MRIVGMPIWIALAMLFLLKMILAYAAGCYGEKKGYQKRGFNSGTLRLLNKDMIVECIKASSHPLGPADYAVKLPVNECTLVMEERIV